MTYFRDKVPEEAVFIIGAGQFGGRAARIMSQDSASPLYVVDVDDGSLSLLGDLPVERIQSDGVRFLIESYHLLDRQNTIIPAVPVHLAFEWVKGCQEGKHRISRIPIPEEIRPDLPHTWPGSDGSLLVSYADFRCPDDCPEPEFCTVSGERRDEPLHDSLSRLNLPQFKVHIIRSHQLAPGLGGYKLEDLLRAVEKVSGGGEGRWLIGTACKCHGIITAFEIEQAP